MYDLILAQGTIYDGLGTPARIEDIAVKGSRIAALGDLSRRRSRRKRIDVKGLVITPGFIDIHSHSDVYYLIHPQAESKIRQGVTTEVIGNCGGSAAPLYGSFKIKRKREWGKLGIKVTWNSFREYIDILTGRGIAVNVVPLIGHGNIRGAVKGFSKGKLSGREEARMHNLLRRELDQGAWGLSTGLIYTPGMYAGTKELIDAARIVAEYKGIYATHIRGEGDNVTGAIEEAVTIAGMAGVNLQISHLKTGGAKNWKKLSKVFEIIERGIRQGININGDRYPYTASNTGLDILLPHWFHNLTDREKGQWLLHRKNKLAGFLNKNLEKGWEGRIWIGRVCGKANKWVQGKSITDIAQKIKMRPEEVVIKLLREEALQVQAIFFNMSEQNLKRILKKPYIMIGSDSSLRTINGPLAIGHPHPRAFGTFPRVISRYTRPITERGSLSLSEAVRKMTGMPAEKLGMKDRGRIKVGAYADLAVFHPGQIKDKAAYKEPFQYPEGIKYVLVNGEIVFENGRCTGSLPGKVLLKH